MRRATFLVLLAATLLLGLAGPAAATDYPVNSTADDPDDNVGDGACHTAAGDCTLRAAVMQANEIDTNDRIILLPGVYQLTDAANEDFAATGDLDITLPDSQNPQALEIVGAGARSTSIVGTPDGDRVFDVRDSTLTLSISDAKITGGTSVARGGGILNLGVLNLTRVTVSGNRADGTARGAANQGGGIANDHQMTLVDTTISGNIAAPGLLSAAGPQGAGIFDNGTGGSTLVNVTIADNPLSGAGAQGGGIFAAAGASTAFRNVTIAGNTAPADGQGAGAFVNGNNLTFVNTIVAFNRAGSRVSNCFGGGTIQSLGHNLEEGTGCNFTASGDIQSAAPGVGLLRDNGGPTDTRELFVGSPAIDAADNALCPGTDQRGVARPQIVACDIGAFELVDSTPPETVITSGPTGLIQARTASFTFSANEVGATFECSLDGSAFFGCTSFTSPVLRGGPHVFMVRARDRAGNVDATPAVREFRIALRLSDLADPVLGTNVNVEPVGVVLWAPPPASARAGARASQKGLTFTPLEEARQIPVGSFLDTRQGTLRLQSARNRRGKRQLGTFDSGLFQVLQSRARRARGLTQLRLKGSSFRRCRTGRRGSAGAAQVSRRTIRRVRSNTSGRYSARGRYSAGTTRGTIWITADRCDGTLTTVRRGKVAVRDFRRKKTIIVRAGKSYLARAGG